MKIQQFTFVITETWVLIFSYKVFNPFFLMNTFSFPGRENRFKKTVGLKVFKLIEYIEIHQRRSFCN